jgi:hypothetical protein
LAVAIVAADGKKAGVDPAFLQPFGGPLRSIGVLAGLLHPGVLAAASPATVLPLWKTAAFATGATAALRLKAAKAARNRFFIGILHL